MVTITGFYTRRERLVVDVSDELAERIFAFQTRWGMDANQFVDAVTKHGAHPLTSERIVGLLSER